MPATQNNMRTHINKFLLSAAIACTGLMASAQGLEDIIVEEYHTVTQADADAYNNNIGGGSYPLVAGMKVYRIYVDMAPGYRLIQVYGDPAPLGVPESLNPLDITTTTFFWNDDNYGTEVPGQTRRFDEGLLFDSYITVNTTGVSGGAAGCGVNTQQFGVPRADDTDGDLTTCGVYPGFTGNDGNIPGTGPTLTYNLGGTMNFAAFTTDGSTFTIVDEGWTTLPASQGVDPNGTNRVLIAQVTTDGELSFHLNVDISDPNLNLERYVWNAVQDPGQQVSPLLTYPPLPADCEGVAGGSALPGTPCDDNNATTGNDTWDNDCNCVGQLIDCEGVAGGPALPGTPCDDEDPTTGNDTWDNDCNCVGTPLFDCPLLEANIGDPCDDGDANTENDTVNASCVCVGTPIVVFDCPLLEANIGDPCDDGDANTENDTVNASCVCVGTPIVVFDCPLLEANIGDACDPGPGFINGVVTANCECVGEPTDCVHDVVIDFATDANGADISWSISPLAGGPPVCSGSGLPSNQSSVLEACCLPDGCYRLVVTDAGGDGISGGGYILRMLSGQRIIDNRDNGAFGSESSLADGEGFCLPLGTDQPIASSCDRAYWVSGNFLVAAENAAVSNVWNTTSAGDPLRANSGYEFWFFDPNGTDDYSFRKLRTHAVSDGFGDVGATRACHIQLNNWAISQHLQDQVLYNVRIRGVVNGEPLSEYGPACRVTLDAALAACPPTKLNDVVGHPNFSCGVTRTFGGPNSASNRIHAMAIAGANQYEFEFSNAGEGYLFSRFSNNVQRHLNWPATAGPALQTGSTYQVRVRARKGAIWCAWGDPCDVTIGGSAAPGTESMSMEEGPATLAIWPNPNSGDQFWLHLDAIEEGVHVVDLDIMDLTGKSINARVIPVTDRSLYTVIDLNGDLATGMYMVNITAGAKRWTERLVIAR